MATIQNRSRIVVTVAKRTDLTRQFPFNQTTPVADYVAELKRLGLKPKVGSTDDVFLVRVRDKGCKPLTHTCTSMAEAQQFIDKISEERSRGLFIDYKKGWNTTFGDLVRRYIREEAPKHKSFEMEAYKLNALLEDAGGERVNLHELAASHPRLAGLKLRVATSTKMRESATSVAWVNKSFALVEPTDFEEYIKERLEVVMPATVDREIDIFSAICRTAIQTWRIPVAQSPMDGVRRPRYFNERDRRLKTGEMDRLLVAVRIEDRELAITNRLEQLVAATKQEAQLKATIYARKSLIKAARASALPMARETAEPVPLMETFFQFQLMTAARRSETLNLTWAHVDLIACTAYLPETKNGRPRTLPLRSSLVELLRRLPRTSERVFPISTDFLRNAWARICERAGVVDLHIHDLRHEGISQMAETGRFSVVDLQAFSGHRDVRMLLRYAHLCARQLAERLNEAFNEGKSSPPHKGRKRLRSGVLPLTEVLEAAPAVTHDDLRRKSL